MKDLYGATTWLKAANVQVCTAVKEELDSCGAERAAITCDIGNAFESLNHIFEEMIALLTCEDVVDVVNIIIVDVCGTNMEGCHI